MRRRNVAYIRVNNKDDYAIEIQKLCIDNYAKENNFEIDYYYIDDGYSGNSLNRPQIRQLLRDIKSKKITDRVVIKDCKRLCNNIDDIGKIINIFSKKDVKLLSTIDNETIKLDIMKYINDIFKNGQLKRRIMSTRNYATIVIPYKMGTAEDVEFQKQKREELKEKGIYNIKFKYKIGKSERGE